jgi:hypothetical protein
MKPRPSQHVVSFLLPLVLAYLVVGMVAKGMGWL